jgi:hypothetical protein
MSLPCDEQDKALFQASTEITIGNWKKAIFWQGRWLQGKAPKDIAPLLYNLAHFKRRTVEKELSNNNWIPSVWYISTREQLLQFVNLWSMLRNVSLNPLAKDEIRWEWTPNGVYTVVLAYKIQFQGSHAPFKVGKLWKASVEPKVKVFGWSAMHQRILTANILASRGLQHSPSYPLCNSNPEDARYLLINCNFAQEVLWLLWSWFDFQGRPTTCSMRSDLASWLAANAARVMPANIRLATRILLYS